MLTRISIARRVGLLVLCAWLGCILAGPSASAQMQTPQGPLVVVQAEVLRICPGWNPHYTLRVANPLAKPLTNLVITDHLPAGTCCATDGPRSDLAGVYDATRGVMVWQVARLDPGAELRLHVVLHVYRTAPHGMPLRNVVAYFANGYAGEATAPVVVVDRNLCAVAAQPWPTFTPTPTPLPPPTRTPMTPFAPPALRFDPPTLDLAQGERRAVTLYVENVRGLYGIQVAIGFDPRIVRIADADPLIPGVQVAPGVAPQPDLVAVNQVDHTVGLARYAALQLGERAPFVGSGAVLTLELIGLAGGVTRLSLTEHLLASPDGLPIAHYSQDAEVSVVAAPLPPRTPLALPANGALAPEGS
ncbi:MAG: cohesin domain-containing protein [Chloroflexota bacterium]